MFTATSAASLALPTAHRLSPVAEDSHAALMPRGAESAAAESDVRKRAPRWLTAPFRPISLKQLNAKADMLQRRDNKYVVRAGVLRQAMAELAKHFDILEIEGERDFTYDTCYFDDADHGGYFEHHQGRRIRCKVRMRKYVDAGLCFVEVKLKHRRGMTIKERLQRPVEMYGTMDAEARDFVATCYRNLYGREFGRALQPALEMRYQRVTLVAKEGGERMTVDIGLRFKGSTGLRNVDGDLFLIEAKSANANGIADKVLRALHQHPTNSCSKYCVALVALDQVQKYNKFLVALRRLGMLPGGHGARPRRAGVHGMAMAHSTAEGHLPWTAGQVSAALG